MFRRAVFALMLIGAAFAGGAAINGPGLAWLQRNFAGGPTIIVDRSGSPNSTDSPTPRQFPTAKSPLLSNIPQAFPLTRDSKTPRATSELALNETPLVAESPSTPASALAPLPISTPPLSDDDNPPVPPLSSDEPRPGAPEPAVLPRLDSPPKSDPVARLASVERPASPPSSWGQIRQKMKELGITRYTIEAEVDGRVRFRCLIPVEGLKAIGHHFEAEGDDELQAAEAALKRIALWKATTTQD